MCINDFLGKKLTKTLVLKVKSLLINVAYIVKK